jgi:exopolysaccharide biosynthesis polyprenyl glycosylphosphotransferase
MAFTGTLSRGHSITYQGKAKLLQFSNYNSPRIVYHGVARSPFGGDWLLFGAKRAIDVVGAGCAIVFFAPLLISIAIAVKATSKGPIFFTQNRYGYLNKPFRIYKFRSMYTHLGDHGGTHQATRHDPRVTRVGRMLRRTSLDELPQLFNVLKGDMSIVGPRPHVPGMLAGGMLYEQLVPYYFQRHSVRPGITGLAQISGCRGETNQPDVAIARIDYDLDYIESWSPWVDIKIIAKTCRREFLSGQGT